MIGDRTPTADEVASALRVLRGAKAEVAEAIEAGTHDGLLTQLVPYADTVATAEGHGDVTLVMERELDL